MEQIENHWDFLRDIVVPAHWSSGDNWRGSWYGDITSGPGALGIAKVIGGSGEFGGLKGDAIESLSAKAYSTADGPIAMTGQLLIEISKNENTPETE